LKEEELRLKDLDDKRIYEKKITDEKRLKEENERIKQWEIKFDAEQKRKEEELIKKFYNNKVKVDEVTEDEIKTENDERY
jgi:hypothetical protein